MTNYPQSNDRQLTCPMCCEWPALTKLRMTQNVCRGATVTASALASLKTCNSKRHHPKYCTRTRNDWCSGSDQLSTSTRHFRWTFKAITITLQFWSISIMQTCDNFLADQPTATTEQMNQNKFTYRDFTCKIACHHNYVIIIWYGIMMTGKLHAEVQ